MTTDLATVPTRQLWNELSGRFKAAVLMVAWNRPDGKEASVGMHYGGYAAAYGLLAIGIHRLKRMDDEAVGRDFDPDTDPLDDGK